MATAGSGCAPPEGGAALASGDVLRAGARSVGARVGTRISPRMLLVGQVLVTAALFFLFGGYRNEPGKIESDGKYYYHYLLSFWFDADVDFTNDYRVEAEPFMVREVDHYGFRDRITSTGRPTNLFTTGPAILWSPFFATTFGLVGLGALAGGASLSTQSGWELHFQHLVMFSAVVYSALALVMLFDLLRPYFSERAVVAGLVLTFWSTNWVYYCIFEPSMSHVYDVFTLVLFVWTTTRALGSGRRWMFAAAGLAAGLHVLVRTQNLVTVAIVVVCLAVVHGRRPAARRLDPANVGVMTGVLAVTLVPLAAANASLFGSIVTLPQGTGFLDLTSPNVDDVLFSARNGLFSHHPSLLLGAVGLGIVAVRWRDHRGLVARLVLPLGLVFLAQLWINASAADWWGGHAFGQRRFVSSLPLFAIGFCALYQAAADRFPERRRVVDGVVAAAVALNLWLVVIHVFMWSYDEPHDVVDWVLFRGPEWVLNGGA